MITHERAKKDISQYNLEDMTMDELGDLLREDFDSSDDDEVDIDFISPILDMMEKRNLESDNPIIFDVQESWIRLVESFVEKGLITESEKEAWLSND